MKKLGVSIVLVILTLSIWLNGVLLSISPEQKSVVVAVGCSTD